MNDTHKSSKMLSDDALERVMLDMFGGGVWESSRPEAQPQNADADSPRTALIDEGESDI